MPFVNLTPHAIGLCASPALGTRILDRSNHPLRLLTVFEEPAEMVDGIQICPPALFNGLVNLPERRPGTLFIVSRFAAIGVAALHPDRDDIVYPATGAHLGATRDRRGVLSVSRLICA